jgi:hypothetical protein
MWVTIPVVGWRVLLHTEVTRGHPEPTLDSLALTWFGAA